MSTHYCCDNTLHRQRAKHHPKNPSSTTGLTIDDPWMTTGGENPKPFLFPDSGSDSRNCLLAFGDSKLIANCF